MAYNGFSATYQPMYAPIPQYQMPQAPAPQQPNSSIIWVQGEAGAKSYLVAPNNTVQLWDSERQTIYLKSADASGMPSMRILDYTFRDATQGSQMAQKPVGVDSPTRDEFNALKGQIEAIRAELGMNGGTDHE